MKFTVIDKVGSCGTLLTAMACPVCWPLFASAGSALGLGVLAPWEGIMMHYVFPPLVLVALLGSYISYRNHRRMLPLLVGLSSGLLILFGFYVVWQLLFMYVGIFGLLIASLMSHLANAKQTKLCLN